MGRSVMVKYISKDTRLIPIHAQSEAELITEMILREDTGTQENKVFPVYNQFTGGRFNIKLLKNFQVIRDIIINDFACVNMERTAGLNNLKVKNSYTFKGLKENK